MYHLPLKNSVDTNTRLLSRWPIPAKVQSSSYAWGWRNSELPCHMHPVRVQVDHLELFTPISKTQTRHSSMSFERAEVGAHCRYQEGICTFIPILANGYIPYNGEVTLFTQRGRRRKREDRSSLTGAWFRGWSLPCSLVNPMPKWPLWQSSRLPS